MQVVQALHVYTMMWLMCQNVHIYQKLLKYSFEYSKDSFLFMFICSCSHTHNNIHVLHTNMLQSQKSCGPMILVNLIDL